MPKVCETPECETVIDQRKRFCEECAKERHRTKVLAWYHKRKTDIAWKTMTVVYDPSPWPLAAGTVLSRHETALMISYGSMTPGTELEDTQGKQYVYQGELCPSS